MELDHEKTTRIKYQDVVYALCNVVDEAQGVHRTDRCIVGNVLDRLRTVLASGKKPIVERHWKGPDAITGLEMDELVARANRADARDGAKAAAIDICRSYNIRGICDPAYIANVIEGALKTV